MATIFETLAKMPVRKLDIRGLTELSWTFPEARYVSAINDVESHGFTRNQAVSVPASIPSSGGVSLDW